MTAARLLGPPLPEPAAATLCAALKRAARTPHGVTLVDRDEREVTHSFEELYASARHVAASLIARGVRAGDRVAIVLPTGRDFIDAFFGAQLAGAVPVPLYPPVRLARMDEYARSTAAMLDAVAPSALLSDQRVRALLGRALEHARTPLHCIAVSTLREAREEAEVEPTGDALGLIQFSSGSTAAPKPVALTHSQLVSQCAALRALLTHPDDERPLGVSWLPLYHDMGLIGCLLSAVTFPGSLVLLGPEVFLTRPALWLRAISRHRATVSPAPNFAYGLCLKRIREDELDGVDLSTWRFALNGAEPVSVAVIDRFAERMAKRGLRRSSLMPVYGMSEAALAVTFTRADGDKRALRVDARTLASTGRVIEGSRAIASVGEAVPGAEVEVRRGDGSLCEGREVGRVWVRAPSIMRGYFADAESTARVVREGWFDTGDLAFVDEGELFVCGRAKDVVIVRGANHAPQEFEECLDGVEGVRVGCSVALGYVPPGEDDEQLLMLVEAERRDVDLARRVTEAIVARTGVVAHSVKLLAPGTLPRTSSGKLRRGEALRRFIAGELRAPAPVGPLTVGLELARSALGYARSRLG